MTVDELVSKLTCGEFKGSEEVVIAIDPVNGPILTPEYPNSDEIAVRLDEDGDCLIEGIN